MGDLGTSQASVEFAIVLSREPDEIHRGPMTEAEADEWIKDWEEMGGRPGAFIVVSREVTVAPWEVA